MSIETAQRSIVQTIIDERKRAATVAGDAAEARLAIPSFRQKLASIIVAHVPIPEIAGYVHQNFSGRIDRVANNTHLYRYTALKPTRLSCAIQTPDGPIEVNLSSSAYPVEKHDKENNRSLPELDFSIDVVDLDQILKINGNNIENPWEIESKSRESSEPRDINMRVYGGSGYQTWPSWKRVVSTEDSALYSDLLEDILSPETQFKPLAPQLDPRN